MTHNISKRSNGTWMANITAVNRLVRGVGSWNPEEVHPTSQGHALWLDDLCSGGTRAGGHICCDSSNDRHENTAYDFRIFIEEKDFIFPTPKREAAYYFHQRANASSDHSR